jgi:hypothetical protein
MALTNNIVTARAETEFRNMVNELQRYRSCFLKEDIHDEQRKEFDGKSLG